MISPKCLSPYLATYTKCKKTFIHKILKRLTLYPWATPGVQFVISVRLTDYSKFSILFFLFSEKYLRHFDKKNLYDTFQERSFSQTLYTVLS